MPSEGAGITSVQTGRPVAGALGAKPSAESPETMNNDSMELIYCQVKSSSGIIITQTFERGCKSKKTKG